MPLIHLRLRWVRFATPHDPCCSPLKAIGTFSGIRPAQRGPPWIMFSTAVSHARPSIHVFLSLSEGNWILVWDWLGLSKSYRGMEWLRRVRDRVNDGSLDYLTLLACPRPCVFFCTRWIRVHFAAACGDAWVKRGWGGLDGRHQGCPTQDMASQPQLCSITFSLISRHTLGLGLEGSSKDAP